MITPEDENKIRDIVRNEIVKALSDVSIKKVGDSPKEYFDLVSKGYLQMHGARATARPKATPANIGQMFFDTTGTGQPQWVDSAGANWRDAASNIVA